MIPRHFVYQRIHVLRGEALHLADHVRIVSRAFEHIYGYDPALVAAEVATRISDCLHIARPSTRTGSTVMLYIAPDDEAGYVSTVEFDRPLLDAGYALSPLRPRAVSYEYSIPFGAFPTGFHLSARELFDTLAFRQHGVTRSVRREGEGLISCGDAPLFAIRGRVLFAPPLTGGAMDGVEREMVIAAAPAARLTVREESVLSGDLKSFDELFFADAAGLTSLAECDGAKFMSLVAPRLARALV
jgi:hypothetical protein